MGLRVVEGATWGSGAAGPGWYVGSGVASREHGGLSHWSVPSQCAELVAHPLQPQARQLPGRCRPWSGGCGLWAGGCRPGAGVSTPFPSRFSLRTPGGRWWASPPPTLWLSSCLSFLICKVGTTVVPSSRGHVMVNRVRGWEHGVRANAQAVRVKAELGVTAGQLAGLGVWGSSRRTRQRPQPPASPLVPCSCPCPHRERVAGGREAQPGMV